MRSLRAFRTVCSSWATTWPTTRRAWTTKRTSRPCARKCPLGPVRFLLWGALLTSGIHADTEPQVLAFWLPPSDPSPARTAPGDAIAWDAQRRFVPLGAQSQRSEASPAGTEARAFNALEARARHRENCYQFLALLGGSLPSFCVNERSAQYSLKKSWFWFEECFR